MIVAERIIRLFRARFSLLSTLKVINFTVSLYSTCRAVTTGNEHADYPRPITRSVSHKHFRFQSLSFSILLQSEEVRPGIEAFNLPYNLVNKRTSTIKAHTG